MGAGRIGATMDGNNMERPESCEGVIHDKWASGC